MVLCWHNTIKQYAAAAFARLQGCDRYGVFLIIFGYRRELKFEFLSCKSRLRTRNFLDAKGGEPKNFESSSASSTHSGLSTTGLLVLLAYSARLDFLRGDQLCHRLLSRIPAHNEILREKLASVLVALRAELSTLNIAYTARCSLYAFHLIWNAV